MGQESRKVSINFLIQKKALSFLFIIMPLFFLPMIQGFTTEKKISLATSLTTTSNLSKFRSTEKTGAIELEMVPQMKLPSQWLALGVFNIEKDLYQDKEVIINDIYVGLVRPIMSFNESLLLKGAVGVILPTSELSRKENSLLSEVQINPSLVLNIPLNTLKGFSVEYGPTFARGIHKYKTSLSGGSNTQYKLRNTLKMGVDLTEKFSVDLSFRYTKAWTYYQNQKVDQYDSTQSLSYRLDDKTGLSIGHSYGGAALKPNGVESNIDLFDRRSSIFFLSFSRAF